MSTGLHGKKMSGSSEKDFQSFRIVMACDAGYVMPLATALRSMVESNRGLWPLQIHVLADSISEDAQGRVARSLPEGAVHIHWTPVDVGIFQELFTVPHVSRMTYARLLIPKMFSDNTSITKVLYIDTDVLVLDNLQPLFDINLDGFPVGAAVDGIDPLLKRGDPLVERVPRVERYFNAGVLLMDLPCWREYRISERALEYLAFHPRSPYMDQDALNFACDRLWKNLSLRWNCQDHFKKKISEMQCHERPAIVHFVTSIKPWNPSARSLNAKFYDDFRSRTAFFRTRSQKLGDWLARGQAHVKSVARRSDLLTQTYKRLRAEGALTKWLTKASTP